MTGRDRRTGLSGARIGRADWGTSVTGRRTKPPFPAPACRGGVRPVLQADALRRAPGAGAGRAAGPAGAVRRRSSAGRVALVALLGAMLVLAGCGLPSHTGPKYAGPAQSAAPTQSEKRPPSPDDAITASTLLTLFLQASVGGNLDTDKDGQAPNHETRERLRQFMTEDMAKSWKPSGGLTVIQDPEMNEEPKDGRTQINLKVQPIGKLDENGVFTPGAHSVPEKLITIDNPSPGKFRFSGGVPNEMYLTVTGLKNWYEWQPIYFREAGTERKSLVPDLRYMPTTLSPAKRIDKVLDWLNAEPSPWLRNVVAAWPDAYASNDNPVIENGVVRVNLGSKAAPLGSNIDELSRLARQIRWSIPDNLEVRLTIEGQRNNATSDGWEADNVAHQRATPAPGPDKFCISGGVVRSVNIPLTGELPLFAKGGQNERVLSAAINSQLNRAAFVRLEGTGANAKRRLWVSSTESPMANPPKYDVVEQLVLTRPSRPAWVDYPAPRLLISDGTKLWASTDANARRFDEVTSKDGLALGPITAFSVAPEGRRIAFIAGGALMVAGLHLEGGNKLLIGTPQRIVTSLGDTQGVGWLSETTLAVGGKPSPAPVTVPRYSLVAITIDGAEETPLPLGAKRPASQEDVTAVVAQPSGPLAPRALSMTQIRVSAMVETNGAAREVFLHSVGPLTLGGPSTSASPSVEPATVTSAFYAD
jgi:hypothetical protein